MNVCFSGCLGVCVLPKGGSVNGFSVSVLVFLCTIQNLTQKHAHMCINTATGEYLV